MNAGGGTVSIGNSTIGPGNTAPGSTGGGLSLFAPTVTIDSTAIISNTVSNPPSPAGGGLLWLGTTSLTMTNSVVTGNTVTGPTIVQGGGIVNAGTSMTIRGTTIANNSVSGGTLQNAGGGLELSSAGSSTTLINSTVSGNSGGGLRLDGSSATATVALSTFGPNTPGTAGNPSALDMGAGTGALNVRGSVIQGPSPACASASITSQKDNVFPLGDISCGSASVPNNDVVADAMLGSLVYNGGPIVGSPDFLQSVNTYLPPSTSPAVEHVPSANCTDVPSGPLTVDQRGSGFGRPVDFDGNGVAQCDAGSVELQATPSQPPADQPPTGGGTSGGSATPAAQSLDRRSAPRRSRSAQVKNKV